MQHKLQTYEFKVKLQNSLYLNYEDPNQVVNHISDILVDAAEIIKIKTVRKEEKNNPPWFDKIRSNVKKDITVLGSKVKKIQEIKF